jgi:hypothetical protein
VVLIGLDVPTQIVRLTGQLEREYEGRVSREVVDTVVGNVKAHYTGAKVMTYVPVFVERESRVELKRLEQNGRPTLGV